MFVCWKLEGYLNDFLRSEYLSFRISLTIFLYFRMFIMIIFSGQCILIIRSSSILYIEILFQYL